ncbi:type IV pilus biogenesis protein PilM [Pallidibacillus pasinlerensis]|uniref:Pilus assembly protein PilM n=1 Tax=Pallidibacillus pasinlerensis TaxID=2703818 RepID=A0ABX0A0K3_9BACI|nr:pilus assembly protein PilM [Pallidibacillus pasinlerensis]NCU16938.1 pilus assembly protein PilM [Pallidibacillus pasinlerensis]
MPSLFSNKKIINLVFDDYALRMVEYNGGGLSKVKNVQEKAIPNGLLEHGRISDELEFYDFMKGTVQDWGIKRRNVRFYVPDSMLIMKKVEFPAELKDDEIKGHFYMELGQTLYLPFDNPIFDVYPLPQTNVNSSTREGLLFSVPEEELMKYVEIFEDAGLKPIVADIRSLGVYRYYLTIYPNANIDEAVLFFEMNLNSINISIFSNNQPEFLRYLDLDISMEDWQADHDAQDNNLRWNYIGDNNNLSGLIDDQMIELERMMNFYRYSLHKGENMVSKICLLGDYPNMELIQNKIARVTPVPVEILDAYLSPEKTSQVPRVYIPALGLALKGEVK